MEWEQQRTGQTVRSQQILLRHIPVERLPAAGANQRGCFLTGAIMRSEDGTRISQVADISSATRRPEATQGYLLAYVGKRLAQHGRLERHAVRCIARSSEAVRDGVGGRLGARCNSQFGVDVLDVRLRGARADEQPRG